MRGFNEGNGSGRLIVDLIIDNGGIYAAQRGGVRGGGSGRGLTPEAYPAPLRSAVGIIPPVALQGPTGPTGPE